MGGALRGEVFPVAVPGGKITLRELPIGSRPRLLLLPDVVFMGIVVMLNHVKYLL